MESCQGEKPASVRQQIVTWHTPQEKLPERGMSVLITFSGRHEMIGYNHCLAIGEYWPEEKKWLIDGISLYEAEQATVHAWADVEPYWE